MGESVTWVEQVGSIVCCTCNVLVWSAISGYSILLLTWQLVIVFIAAFSCWKIKGLWRSWGTWPFCIVSESYWFGAGISYVIYEHTAWQKQPKGTRIPFGSGVRGITPSWQGGRRLSWVLMSQQTRKQRGKWGLLDLCWWQTAASSAPTPQTVPPSGE